MLGLERNARERPNRQVLSYNLTRMWGIYKQASVIIQSYPHVGYQSIDTLMVVNQLICIILYNVMYIILFIFIRCDTNCGCVKGNQYLSGGITHI